MENLINDKLKNSKQIEKDWGSVWELEEIKEADEKDPTFGIVSSILSRYSLGARILDAGSGTGKWVFFTQRKGYEAYGIDIVHRVIKRSCEYARNNSLDCKFKVGDVRRMSFPDNFFDVIISFGTIEHFPESSVAVKEFYRTLKIGGTCFITTPNIYCVRTFITRPILKILKNPRLGYQGYEKSFTPNQLFKMMKDAGFKNLKFGILPDGILLGNFYKFIPIAGKYLANFFRKISFWIEKRQSKFGHTSFCIGTK